MTQGGKRPGAGRKKGVPNKLTSQAKDHINKAFEKLGSVDGLVRWAESDSDCKKAFYTQIWPKIVPHQVEADIDSTVNHTVDPEAAKRAEQRIDGLIDAIAGRSTSEVEEAVQG